MCVSTCLKGGVGGRKSQRCQLFTMHCSRFRRLEGLLVVVDEGGGSWGQSQGCYLGNNCKIASSPLLVMVGFFSLCCFLFFAQPCEAHLAIQRLGPIRAQGNGLFLLYFVFVYLKPPLPKNSSFPSSLQTLLLYCLPIHHGSAVHDLLPGQQSRNGVTIHS